MPEKTFSRRKSGFSLSATLSCLINPPALAGVLFSDPGDREPTLADTAFYLTDENGEEYYCCGNTKIKITEHFAEEGKTMGELLEDLILREAKKTAKD